MFQSFSASFRSRLLNSWANLKRTFTKFLRCFIEAKRFTQNQAFQEYKHGQCNNKIYQFNHQPITSSTYQSRTYTFCQIVHKNVHRVLGAILTERGQTQRANAWTLATTETSALSAILSTLSLLCPRNGLSCTTWNSSTSTWTTPVKAASLVENQVTDMLPVLNLGLTILMRTWVKKDVKNSQLSAPVVIIDLQANSAHLKWRLKVYKS